VLNVRLLTVTLAVLGLACDPPRGKVETWRPSDHQADAKEGRGQGQTPQDTANKDASQGLAATVWKNACASCHGPVGRGDGPLGPSLKAPDLTRPEWLETVSDEQIIATIRNGKDKMPAHPDLPDAALDALVKRIRNRGR
jgi:mono/diheme cytochrome c family protein